LAWFVFFRAGWCAGAPGTVRAGAPFGALFHAALSAFINLIILAEKGVFLNYAAYIFLNRR